MSKAHAKLSASSASRWMNCSGSIALIEKAPPPRESKYAAEGTTAHECMEHMLKESMTREQLFEKYGKEMVEYVDYMYGAVHDRLVLGTEKLLVEEKVTFPLLDHEGNEMFGTVDTAIVDIGGRLSIIDFKYGAGVAVEPEKNLQMIYYAVAIAAKYKWEFDEVELVIVQPRAFHVDSVVRAWTLTIEELKTYVDLFKKGIERVKSKARTFAGDWCKFCAGSVICPEQTSRQLEKANIAFSEPLIDNTPAFPQARDLTPSQISIVMQKADILKSWIDEVYAYAEDVLNRGGEVPGFKLVEKRGSRKWVNPIEVEKDAADAFGSKAYSRELLSPAQMEKVAGKEWVEPRVVSVSSGLTMVADSDKRPAVNPMTKTLTAFDEPLTNEVTNDKKESEKISKDESKSESENSGKKTRSKKSKTKNSETPPEQKSDVSSNSDAIDDCGF